MTDPADDGSTQPAGRGSYREQYRQQLLTSLGGWSGTVITAIPTVVFVVVNALAGLRPAIVRGRRDPPSLLAVYRLLRKQSVQQAITGLFGVVIAALIAGRTGQARGYFLFGIWTSFAYAAAFAVSLIVRRPLVGLLWEFLDPSPGGARTLVSAAAPAARLRVGDRWRLVVFLARGVVQTALFRENATGWLAVARIAMGYPLYPAGGGVRVLGGHARSPAARATGTDSLSRLANHHVADRRFGLGQRDEEQLVAGLERLLGRGRDDPLAADDRHQRRVVGQQQVANRGAGTRRTFGQGDLDQVGLTLAEA